MKILHLLSQKEITGAEAYAATLIREQIQAGHEVWLVSDTFTLLTQAKYIPLALDKRSILHRLKNYLKVRKLIKLHQFDILHAHSRASSWIAYYARKGFSKTTLISTVHGCQKYHGRWKKYDVFGSRILAVAENIKTHLTEQLGLKASKITVIPNLISVSHKAQSLPPTQNNKVHIGLLGRLSGPKGEHFITLLEKVLIPELKMNPNLFVTLAGGEIKDLSENHQSLLNTFLSQCPEQIRVLGRVIPFEPVIEAQNYIVASGRIAVEAILKNKPCYVMGEARLQGWFTDESLNSCLEHNFGDIGVSLQERPNWESPDHQEILSSLVHSFHNIKPIQKETLLQLQTHYSPTVNASQIEEIYRSERMRTLYPKWIPVWMYHKIPSEELDSKHKIFVTQKNFRKHLKFLSLMGFKAVSLEDYFDFRNGRSKFFPKKPILLSFDDGYKDNLIHAAPLLNEFNFKSSLYLLSETNLTHNSWDTHDSSETSSPLMNLDERQKLKSSPFRIASHGIKHEDLTLKNAEESLNEFQFSKQALEKEFSLPIRGYAYAFGKYSHFHPALIKKTGYEYAVCTDQGGQHIEDDLYQIFRVNIFPHERVFSLYKKSSSWYRAYFDRKRGRN